ncbi:MAG: helix-turn-helix transcriptional regulator [Pseudomonadota bacterium]
MTVPDFMTTREVADLLRVKERKVYDMAAEGTIPCRRVTGKLLFPRTELMAWLDADGPVAPAPPDVVAGSHDPLLDWAIRESGSGLATFFDGSLDGLGRIADGQAIAAGLHVFEPDRGDWNIGLVSDRLGSAPIVLVEWARRQQGLILPAGSGVSEIADLTGRRVARRQATAGAGLLFDHLLHAAGMDWGALGTDPPTARTETEAAAAVASGEADAAPGLQAVARQFGLDFLPTQQERFDLIVNRRAWFEPAMQQLIGFARSEVFAAKAGALGGYDISGLGTVRWNAG